MPNPSVKVAAMASIFQQQVGDEKDEDTAAETVKKGRRSFPLYGESGFVKQKKAGLKRTNSQKDRFSNARMMFEKKVSSGDNLLDSSRSSITSVLSNTNKASTRQSISVSSVSDEEEAEKKDHKVKVISESNLPNNLCQPPPTTPLTSKLQALSPNKLISTALPSKPEWISEAPLDCSPSPPPLPSLPPPPLVSGDKPSLLGEDEILLLSNLKQQPASSCQTDLEDIAKKLSFSQNIACPDLVPEEGSEDIKEDKESGTSPLSDSQVALQVYSELCDSLPSVECSEIIEEFDRLADLTDLDQIDDKVDNVLNSEVKCENVQGIDESHKPSPQVLECIIDEKSPNFTRSSNESDYKSLVNDDEITFPKTPTESLTEEQNDLQMKAGTLDENQNKSLNNKSQTTSEDGNSSSIGSSLVCQSVSSWLGTPGSVTGLSNTDPSHEAETGDDDSKHVASPGESSDYVSGDSCEFRSSSSSPAVESTPSLGLQDGVETKIHYLNDGNFWYEGHPLVPTSQLEDITDTSELYHPPSLVKFSVSPVRIFSTYTEEEYDRSNDSIDPAAASAEYELEKRVEKMEKFEVSLTKGEDGLGLSILGMGVGVDTGVEKLGIFIKTITAGGAAAKDGRIQVNDQIISVDGSCLVGVTQAFAASVLRNTAGLVRFVVGRDEEPGESEVAQLIRQSVQADVEGDEEPSGEEQDSSDGVSHATLSSVEGELSSSCELWEKGDSSYGEDEGCSVTSLAETEQAVAEMRVEQGDENTDTVDQDEDVNVINEDMGQDTTVEKENIDNSASQEEEDPKDTSTMKMPITAEKSVSEEVKTDDAEDKCCSHQEDYKKLLSKFEQAQETMGKMERNMSIVTEQLLTREQLFSSHMSRLRVMLSLLEEELPGTDTGAACHQALQALRSALEPRGVLRRKPFIPTHPTSADTSSLDLAIPSTPLLDTTLARDKASLVQRATLPRRRVTGLAQRLTTMGAAQKVVPEFQDELRKTLMRNTRKTAISECQDSSTPPLSPSRASSLPSSPTISQYSSSSSLHSVPGCLDGVAEFKREKKRLSGKSLWQKARRRLSSR